MNKIIFFDTETTGNTDKDYLCQIAYKDNDLEFNKLYKPPVRIPAEASAVHHISNKMVEDKPLFKESEDYKNLKDLFESNETISVAHNAPFDIGILKNEDISVAKFICTLRVARALDPEESLSSYRLQFLRYALDIEIEAIAHDAFGDVLVLEKLFDRLKNKIKTTENINDEEAIARMIEISSHPSIFKRLNFGKHKGKTIEEVVSTDRGWLEWLLGEKMKSDQNEEDWIYTLKHYLNK